MAAPVSADAIGKARAWVFTWNNYTHTVLFPDGLPAGIKYCIYSAEKGADGTPHLQGYIVFNTQRHLGGIRKIVCKTVEGVIFKPFETAHLAIAKGDAKSNKAYCSKMDETHVAGPWELGELPKQGARMDLEEAVAKLMETHGDFTQIDQVTLARNAHGLATIVTWTRHTSLDRGSSENCRNKEHAWTSKKRWLSSWKRTATSRKSTK